MEFGLKPYPENIPNHICADPCTYHGNIVELVGVHGDGDTRRTKTSDQGPTSEAGRAER